MQFRDVDAARESFLQEEAKDLRKEIESYERFYFSSLVAALGLFSALLAAIRFFAPIDAYMAFILIFMPIAVLFFYPHRFRRKIYLMEAYLVKIENIIFEPSGDKSPLGFTRYVQNAGNVHWLRFNPTFPRWVWLSLGTLLRRRFLVNRNAFPAADPGRRGTQDPSAQADPGCFGPSGRSRRTVLPSALAAPRSARVRPQQRAVLGGGRSGAGSRRTRHEAPPPRPAGTRGSGRGARSGRQS
jgi:hypothetical protein